VRVVTTADDPPRVSAVVLLSGGLDSSTVLALARAAGHEVYALSFRYGQRHEVELQAARRQARAQGVVRHVEIDLGHVAPLLAGATSLVSGSSLSVPKGEEPARGGIPNTYVPARNTLFLSYALAWAEALGAHDLWIGVNAVDYSGYPDCRPPFIAAFERLANLATREGVEGRAMHLHAPLLHLQKREIIRLGADHGVDFADTVSCYDPVLAPPSAARHGEAGEPAPDEGVAWACGRCDSCQLRRQGFIDAGIADPTRYWPRP
jgi:7-cyano-7-deazaguanine synthase